MATGSSKATSPNTELDEDDLKLLYNTLYRIRKKYASLGIQIGLKKSEIDDIEAHKLDPGKSLLEVLSIGWNKAQPLTWNDIYSALRSECVDEGGLAERIRQKYGHLFVPESSTESESEQDHEIKSEEIKRVKKRAPKKQKGSYHRARVSKERERSSEDEGVRSKKHMQEVESEDEEDAVLSRKEKKEKVRRKGAHYQYRELHDKGRPKGKNKKEKFMKDESQSEPEEVVREKSKRKKKATYNKEESVKGYGDRDDEVMKEMIISPESQQAKIISLIDALDEMIKSHPGHLFSCIEVMLKNEVLQEPGREMLSKAGKTNHFLYRALFIYTFFFSAKVCPAIAAAKFPSQVSPSDLAVVVSTDVVGMQTVTICVVTVVCLLCSTFILQKVRGRHKKGCPAQPQKALHSLCLHPVQVQAMLHHLRQ